MVAIQVNVIQSGPGGCKFQGVFLPFVTPGSQFRMARQAVVIQVDFGVQGDQLSITGDHQRVDLDQTAVVFYKKSEKVGQQVGKLPVQCWRQAQAEGDLAAMKRLDCEQGIDLDPDDPFRGIGGNRLDIHTAGLTGHDQQGGAGAIGDDAQVEFPDQI
jgi:hypothetical protein